MKSKKLIVITTAAALGLGALTIGASAWAKNKRGGGERMANRVTEMLSLDEGQVEAFKSLQLEVQETRDLMQAGRGNLMNAMSEFIADDTFDQEQALATINERVAAFQSNAPDLVNAAAIFFDGLNAEQKAQLTEKMEKMQKRHGNRGGRG